MSGTEDAVKAEGLRKSFDLLGEKLEVLNGLSLRIKAGESVAVMGPSGSGKTTLLSIVGGLLAPDEGRVLLGGEDPYQVSEIQRDRIRNRHIGFLFQFHHLIPELSALENAAMPLWIRGVAWEKALAEGELLLRDLGLSKRLGSLPHQLSGGERQRAALARALACSPRLLIADEPTGNLDRAHAERVQSMLVELGQSRHVAVAVATHNDQLAKAMDRVLVLKDGVLA